MLEKPACWLGNFLQNLGSYRDDKFPEAYVPTSFDNLEKVISMNG